MIAVKNGYHRAMFVGGSHPFVVGTSPGRRLPVRRRDFPPGSPPRIWLLASFSGANLHRYDYV
ncbi:MAG: hypothetical protein A2W18_09405 [Candidatus Muproteobacteria bacterium RBG_16_60_9]|uniref:Uncharacterized protein n=1 Tax=Candidatus Muproteobacteria bacterium RBG_16_60_9 TaxID=1817755 RepID=A0A1F6V4J1_9PROT|nr:MAG: hypothetical protein A2W18_09405 [Candidatus Muproteobacteria bacterium RBG_16_60_9]